MIPKFLGIIKKDVSFFLLDLPAQSGIIQLDLGFTIFAFG